MRRQGALFGGADNERRGYFETRSIIHEREQAERRVIEKSRDLRRFSTDDRWTVECSPRRARLSQRSTRSVGKMVAEVRYTALPTIEEALFWYRRRAA
jgi:hypothetical protein